MNFDLNPSQQQLVQTVREFVQTELLPLEDEVELAGALSSATAKKIFERSKALGLYASNIPKQYGGGGLNALDTMLVEEQYGHAKDILVRRAFGNVYEVLLEGDDYQKQRWLLPCVQGERTCSIAITEPEAGSDAASIRTRAIKDGDGWVLSGHKYFISDAAFSDFFVVSAVTDPAARPKHVSLFLVDKNLPGVTVGRDRLMMGLVGTSHCDLFFDEVRLGPECLLGGEGRGLRLALEVLGRVRLAQVGARAVGKASRLLQLMIDWANERQQFGKPIGDFQLVQAMIADSTIEINSARLLLHRAAWEIDQHRDAREWISMVKIDAAEMLGRVSDRAVQVFGGTGYARDVPVERMYRDARIYRIYDGTSEIHRGIVARGALKQGGALFDSFVVPRQQTKSVKSICHMITGATIAEKVDGLLQLLQANGLLPIVAAEPTLSVSGSRLPNAAVIVAGGRGLGNRENFERLLKPLAAALGGVVAGSGAVVNEGWVALSQKVGLTGQNVRPRLYIAIGVSGAVQHRFGLRGAQCVVAINRDANAPIFNIAHYGMVGDCNEIVPMLIAALNSPFAEMKNQIQNDEQF